MTVPARHAPATLRNREPILAVLRRLVPTAGLLLEIASGTGEHAAYMAPLLPQALVWQPSDADPERLSDIDIHAKAVGATNLRPALHLDATWRTWPVEQADVVFCCNMVHISPWSATQGLFSGAARLLPQDGSLIIYGPFFRENAVTAASNEAFDAALRSQDRRWGLRCLDRELVPLATRNAFTLDEVIEMPANNVVAVFRRRN